jgi:hypothetical protein
MHSTRGINQRENERNMERGTRSVEQGPPAQDTSEPGHLPVQGKKIVNNEPYVMKLHTLPF